MVAAENDVIPGAKVGGVADVVRDAPQALAKNSINVDVVIPDHNHYHQGLDASLVATIDVPFRGQLTSASLYKVHHGEQAGINQYVIWHPSFDNDGKVYHHDQDGRPFAFDANKFALFSAALCEFLKHDFISRPDVIHLHDWHAAIVAVLLAFDPNYQNLSNIKRVYTVHNIALQGVRPLNQDDSSLEAWFPHLAYQGQLICDPIHLHCFNPMRAGITLSDKVHVVSPTYSQEVQLPSNNACGFYGGEGLENDLKQAQQADKLVGILNGCEYPESTTAPISMSQFLAQASQCLLVWAAQSAQLRSTHFIASERIRQWQSQDAQTSQTVTAPVVTSVGRLTEQKVRLLTEADNHQQVINSLLDTLAKHQGRCILIGSGDTYFEEQLTIAMAKHNNFLFLNGFDSELSLALYPLGDLFLMPSSFEPCGISQMLAMRVGQPCIVNQVGGLKDTVQHLETGFSFSGENIEQQKDALLQCFSQALTLFNDEPKHFQQIAQQAKHCRFDWQASISQYLTKLYQ